MKLTLILFSLIVLSGCERCFTNPVVDRVKATETFNECLDKAAKARSGQSYSTNDDEDYDEVIEQCRVSSLYLSITSYERICE